MQYMTQLYLYAFPGNDYFFDWSGSDMLYVLWLSPVRLRDDRYFLLRVTLRGSQYLWLVLVRLLSPGIGPLTPPESRA